ncbi:MAG: IS21 family transposase [Chloroflexota bacterium]
MTATNAQINIVMRERKKGRTQEQAAVKANLKSRQTVAKYEQLGQLPSELKKKRRYRTRQDPFAQDWEQVKEMLKESPELEAKTLFDWLCEQHPKRYQAGQLRTFQRKVAKWRAKNQGQVATLEQIRKPGEQMQTDGTWLTELNITIQGEKTKFILIHCVLPYSNWSWGRVAPTESLPALQLALQSSLQKLGRVPRYHQTDNSSAATKELGVHDKGKNREQREYTDPYLHLLNHFGMEPQVTHVNSPNENGDIEAANGSIKRSLNQHLLLRGSREFDSLEAFEAFIHQVMDKRNQLRSELVAEELAVMRSLPSGELATYVEKRVKVGSSSLIRVLKNCYSVPTSLIGRRITVRIGIWHIELYYDNQFIERIPKLIGQNSFQVNYRHIIGTLLRKPGGFRNYRYREALFPSTIFKRAWEQLNDWYAPRRADIIYLQVLHLAAQTWESEVATALELLTEQQTKWGQEDVIQLVQRSEPAIPQMDAWPVNLHLYDQLLAEDSYVFA